MESEGEHIEYLNVAYSTIFYTCPLYFDAYRRSKHSWKFTYMFKDLVPYQIANQL